MNIAGIIFITLFCLLTSFREVFVSSLLQNLDPITGIFVTFLPVTLFFLAFQTPHLQTYLAKCRSSRKTLAILNLSTLGSWFGFYFAVQNLEPAISCSVTFALGPIITMLMEPFFGARRTRNATELSLSLILAASACYLLWVSASGRSSLGEIPFGAVVLGFGATLLSAFATVFNTFTCKRLSQDGLGTFEIMGARFTLLLGVTGAILFLRSTPSLSSLPVGVVEIGVMAATVIIPLIVFQKAIVRLPPFLVSLALASMPLMTICLEAFDQRLEITPYTVAGIIVGFLASTAAIVRLMIPHRETNRA